ncbi:dinucleotide-utilizing protein [Paramagnetospirillum caucaseum]|uniref:Molybdopterin-synthase adenylyltransferase n=1 Tax=Paramagnetospirillum caucaseum TaxID=1244869 RepID=M3AFT4_9PROT|nr:molybdopterin-synthase adenylyltransferase MoeB [Paramagnetospirillum caucaseum]EME71698.1 dinucleotide-utilizing protein [Paramagnetospirillum caucaseum]
MDFTEEQIHRYARHIILPEVGGIGQAKLLGSSALVIGAGGLGSPVILYLAAAGVGTIGVIDDDDVELSNLQRQIIHRTSGVGTAKVASAANAVADINPDVKVVPIRARLDKDNAREIFRDFQVIADGSDNFPTRFLVNDAARLEGKTLVSAAILRFDGQLSTYRPGGPCYRCIYREAPPEGHVPTCSSAGVLGAIAGTMGAMQATEVLKELLGIGESLAGKLVIYDALAVAFRTVRVPRDPGCPLCGDHPTITDLSGHGSTANVCG